MEDSTVKRLNWGCGSWTERGWINADLKDEPGVDIVGDIREGLPLESDSIDYAVSIHSLPEIPIPEIRTVLLELRRVLKPEGVLRVSLPDFELGFRAYERGDRDYFLIPDDDARSIGAKLVTQLIWYGYSRTLFTQEFITEMLERAGFSRITSCEYRQTASPNPEITDLDNREAESLFVEAVK